MLYLHKRLEPKGRLRAFSFFYKIYVLQLGILVLWSYFQVSEPTTLSHDYFLSPRHSTERPRSDKLSAISQEAILKILDGFEGQSNEVEAIGWSRTYFIIPSLGRNYEKSIAVRIAAIEALGNTFPATAGILTLIYASRHDREDQVKKKATEVLNQLSRGYNPDAIPQLIKELLKTGPISEEVTDFLAHIGSPAINGLQEALRRPDWIIREYAAIILGKMGDVAKTTIPTLSRLLTDFSPGYESAHVVIVSALVKIGADTDIRLLNVIKRVLIEKRTPQKARDIASDFLKKLGLFVELDPVLTAL